MKKLTLISVFLCICLISIEVLGNEKQPSLKSEKSFEQVVHDNEVNGGVVVIEKYDTVRLKNDLIVGSIGQGAKLIVNGILIVEGNLYNAFGSSIVVNGGLRVGGTFSNFESELDVQGCIRIVNGFDNKYGSVIKGTGDLLVAKLEE